MAIPSLSTNGTAPKRERASASSQVSLFRRWILMENRFMICQSKFTVFSSRFSWLAAKETAERWKCRVDCHGATGNWKLAHLYQFSQVISCFYIHCMFKIFEVHREQFSLLSNINKNNINFSAVHFIKMPFKLFNRCLHECSSRVRWTLAASTMRNKSEFRLIMVSCATSFLSTFSLTTTQPKTDEEK